MKKIRLTIESFVLAALLAAGVYAGGFGGGTTTITALATSTTGVQTTAVSNSANYYPLMAASSVNATQTVNLDASGLTYNPATDIFAAGKFSATSGVVTSPAIYLSPDTTSGLYRIGADNVGVAIAGVKILDIASTGLNTTGVLNATGYITSSGTVTIGQISASNASFQNTSGKALAYGDAAITQGSSGATTLNSSAGQVTYLSINNAAVGTVSASGIASSGFLYAGTTLKTGGYTVATLPAAATGMRTYVTDAVAPTYLGALVGGGAVVVPVFYNGSAWVSD